MEFEYSIFESPFGYMGLIGKSGILYRLVLPVQNYHALQKTLNSVAKYVAFTFAQIKRTLELYFSKQPVDFNKVNVALCGLSKFTVNILTYIRGLKYGQIVTYKDLANIFLTSPRAIGRALSKNPIPIVIPCHRVVSMSGLGGYSGGIILKHKLLALEGVANIPKENWFFPMRNLLALEVRSSKFEVGRRLYQNKIGLPKRSKKC